MIGLKQEVSISNSSKVNCNLIDEKYNLEEMMLFKTFSTPAYGNLLLCQESTWGQQAYFNKDSNGEPIF